MRILLYYWDDTISDLNQMAATMSFDSGDVKITDFDKEKLDSEIKLNTALDHIFKEAVSLRDFSKVRIKFGNTVMKEFIVSEFTPYRNKTLEDQVKKSHKCYHLYAN